MSTPDSATVLRTAYREVTLCLLGIAQLYDLNAATMATTARALGEIYRSRIPDLVIPPLGRGRAALMVLADALRVAEPVTKTTDKRTQ